MARIQRKQKDSSKKTKLTKKQKVSRSIGIIFLVIALIGVGVLGYMLDALGKIPRTEIPIENNVPEVNIDDLPAITDDSPLDPILTDRHKGSTSGKQWGDGRVSVYYNKNFPIQRVTQIDKDVVNILVFGVDARSVNEVVCRADALMIMSIDSKTNTIKLTSIMRDSQMKIPGKTIKDKVTHAYAYGGVGLLVNTINQNLNLDIQRFVMFDFFSAEDVINAVGGIKVDITEKELKYVNDNINHLNKVFNNTKKVDKLTKAGEQMLDGRQSVAYARVRYNGGDQRRTQRQRVVVDAMLTKFFEASATTKISAINQLFGTFETNMTNSQLINLGIKGMANISKVDQYRVPEEKYATTTTTPSWQWVVDWDGQNKVIHEFIYG